MKIVSKVKKKMLTLLYGNNIFKCSDSEYAIRLHKCVFGKTFDLNNPQTFNEHICAFKVSDAAVSFGKYIDKYAVRDYIKETVGDKYLNEVYGIYDSFSDIPFSGLPDRFVIKATHSSGMNMIVKEKLSLDLNKAESQVKLWLSKNYYYRARERNYCDIKPRILVEKYIVSKSGFLDEYKFFCFRGQVKCVSVNRFSDSKRETAFYDKSWRYMNVKNGYETIHSNVERPANFDEMVKLAEMLSKQFDFVRVDIYNVDGMIYFSELTFTPGGGLVPFEPESFDLQLGMCFDDPMHSLENYTDRK